MKKENEKPVSIWIKLALGAGIILLLLAVFGGHEQPMNPIGIGLLVFAYFFFNR